LQTGQAVHVGGAEGRRNGEGANACGGDNSVSAGGTDGLIFDREISCCRPALYPAALKMTGNPCDAEDLVQETMLRAYVGLQHFAPGTNARAWLRQIMANVFVSASRKRHREVVQVLRPELDAPLPDRRAPGVTRSAEDEVLSEFVHSRAGQAVRELPECYRAVVYLYDAEGYCLAEIAELIGAPVGTVMSRLHRGRARLRRRLARHLRSEFSDSQGSRMCA
jgi:RNA polymerase sigma-70 factor, ECF subfamily